ncbi:MAG TPA: single-stranded DNA-binding protein [Gallicola sp.]|nr:single-stranded DNA-binding protein [Gallicola sp.]
MNNVCIIGRLTKDLETRTSPSGTTIAKTSIAVNRKFKKEEADFINLIAFNKTAELMSQYLGKGSQVGIEGRIQTGSYDNKEGKKVYTFDVVVDNITFLDSKKTQEKEQASPYDIPVAEPAEEYDPYKNMGEQISLDEYEDEID